MPWKECEKETARWKFVQAMLSGKASIAALCREHEISRSCGYKWWRRFRRGGSAALREQSRKPRDAERLQQRWRGELLRLRRKRPTWGPQKLHWVLARAHPRTRVPGVRTLGRWLAEAGLAQRRQRRSPAGPAVAGPAWPKIRWPNDLWTIDFKGKFRTADAGQVNPLTVRDAAACCVLAVRHLSRPTDAAVRRRLTALFRRHGLPKAVQVDNGTPFCGQGARGWSTLTVWWLRLGLQVLVGRPGCPQDNGAHEQMHRVLKAETARPPAANVAAQQRRFERWRRHYNDERPHAGLGLRTPGSCYRPSPRRLPRHLPAWSYPRSWQTVRPGANGRAWWSHRQRLFGRAFAGESLGLRPRPAGWTEVYLGPHLIGVLHPADRTGLRPARTLLPKRTKGRG